MGFKSMPWRMAVDRLVFGPIGGGDAALTDVNLAEIILRAVARRQAFMQACR